MTKTPNTKTMITFHTNAKGVRYATYFGAGARNMRMKLAEAELMIATGAGIEEAKVNW